MLYREKGRKECNKWLGAKIYFLQVKGSHQNAKICSKGNKNKGRRSPPVQFTVGGNTKTQTGESFKQEAVWLCEGGEGKIWRLPSTSCPTPSQVRLFSIPHPFPMVDEFHKFPFWPSKKQIYMALGPQAYVEDCTSQGTKGNTCPYSKVTGNC